MSWKDGDDINPGQAKKILRAMLDDPKYKREKGHPDDALTVDDPLPDGEADDAGSNLHGEGE